MASQVAIDRAFFLYQEKQKATKKKRRRKKRKKIPRGFFQVMTPRLKLAFLFFGLAKISCFTVAPLFLVLAWTGYIPRHLDWLGTGIYGLFILLSLFFGAWEWLRPTDNVPSKSEVEKWMQYYNLDNSR